MRSIYLYLVVFAALTAPSARAGIPDFVVENAPEAVKNSGNPKAGEFWRELVEHSKKQGRQMFRDTQKTTGLKSGDMRKADWDCLFWRVAASFAKMVRRANPGLQPPEFADQLERTSLDDDCPDQGGPGSYGVQVYNTAINKIMAGRGGWQKSATDAPIPNRENAPPSAKVTVQLMQAFMAVGIFIEGAATAAVNAVPVPIVLPREVIEKLDPHYSDRNPGTL